MQSLKEQIQGFLEARELNFEFEEENNLFRLNFNMENTTVHVVISYNDEKRWMLNRA